MHHAILNRRADDGSTQRAHLESAAARGSITAARELEGPELPDALSYLVEWIHALSGRSGVGMSGFAPLTWSTIGEWSRFTGIDPDVAEIDALFVLDSVLLNPVALATDAVEPEAVTPWPTKRVAG